MDISKAKCVFQRREAEREIWSSCEIVTLLYMELFGKDTTAILQRKMDWWEGTLFSGLPTNIFPYHLFANAYFGLFLSYSFYPVLNFLQIMEMPRRTVLGEKPPPG